MKDKNSAILSDPIQSAQEAHLSYVDDSKPSITRRYKGKKFLYFGSDGKQIRDTEVIARINHLVIPPAWKEVWICPNANGHLQATGRDVRGRKQYRYHTRWRKTRDETKYEHIIAFGRALPKIRRRVVRDLKQSGLSREKVLATVVRLLETTLIRVGNDEYARDNRSYGLTTMHNRHVDIHGSKVTFSFRGKSGKKHVIDVENPRLAKIVRRCRDLPGYELFEYINSDGQPVNVTSFDINQYLREITKGDFTAKDFRTWAGTVLAARALQEFKKFSTNTEAKRNMVSAIEAVAKMLGNTPAICRRCYIHPTILDTYLDGSLIRRLKKKAKTKLTNGLHSLRPEEVAVLMLLQQTF
ncbi:MAG: DNA topoisomerase IB [Chthoniobacterales bacterium]